MEEAHEYELPRARYFVARRLELVAVSGRLWISWCVLGRPDILGFFFSFLLRQGRKSEATETVLMRQGRRSEAAEPIILPLVKMPLRHEARMKVRIDRGSFLP